MSHMVMGDEEWVMKTFDHPDLEKTLVLPLCGEPRVAYCYVHPDKTGQFERYVRNELSAQRYCSTPATGWWKRAGSGRASPIRVCLTGSDITPW